MSLVRKTAALMDRAFIRAPSLLLLLALAAAAVWLFVELAEEVLEGETRALDRALLRAFRSPGDLNDPLGPLWVEVMMRDLSALGGVSVLTVIVLASAGYLILSKRRRTALLLCFAGGGAVVLSAVLKTGFSRPRPELVPYGSIVYSASFPSGHAMLSSAVYLVLGMLLASVHPELRLRVYLLGAASLLTLLVGISRVYLGVHWPTDVVAGWAAGTAWASLVCWLSLRLDGRKGVLR